ncbi:MAG: hypothetical protein WCI79_02120 [Candidatus Saccharibacteria bacterium]
MNKKVIMFFVFLFSIAGGYLPVVLGVDIFSAWSILGGMIGGFVGIGVGVMVSKRFG